MDEQDEAELLRINEEARRILDQLGEEAGEGGAPCLVCQTTTIGSYPTTAASFYGVKAGITGGAEVEGGPGTTTTYGTNFFALNLGSAVPPASTKVICTFVPNRWVFRYDG